MTQPAFDGTLHSPKPASGGPGEQSAKYHEVMSRKPPPWWSDFYAMLDRVGVKPTGWEAQELASALDEVDDYPVEWIEPLEAAIRRNGVTSVRTIIRYVQVSKQRNISPGSRPGEAPQELPDDASVAAIMERTHRASALKALHHLDEVNRLGEDIAQRFLKCSTVTHSGKGCPIVQSGVFDNEYADAETKAQAAESVKPGWVTTI